MTASWHALGSSRLQAPTRVMPVLDGVTVRPARMPDVGAILGLHREAFADKFGGAFGVDATERGAAALAATWEHQGAVAMRGMFVAEYQGQIVGTTTIRTWEMISDQDASVEVVFHEELGFWRTIRSLFVLSLLDHQIGRREGFITDVAVLPAYRRSGIAQMLLARAEQEALLRGKHHLGLYVSQRNEAARALYQRLGFYQHRSRRSLLTWFFFGQGHWLYLRKNLV
ncbi:MAG: GNAT family N-acetyltransferase [Chloroflexia bacterium]|nr:GNAT family N-acetyltransferase [Chloroflexia bacterium]